MNRNNGAPNEVRKHGGARKGAGKKRLYGKNQKLHSIYLPDELWKLAQEIGKAHPESNDKRYGTQGIRYLLRTYKGD